jgi:protein TonB
VLWLALGLAVVLHLSVLLLVALPESKPPVAPADQRTPPVITDWVIPPPEPERPRPPQQPRAERMLPVPDPDPERPEPIRERVRDDIQFAPPSDVPIVYGDPDPPPPEGPYELTTAAIVPPELIGGTKVHPRFPELARAARLSGRVILRAVIGADGSVGEIEVLDCSKPGLGFEEAAAEAVARWRYEPATLRGRPVPVYLVVQIRFTLR